MHVGDIGTLFWIVIVIFGLISSIRRSARRAQDPVAAQQRAAALAQQRATLVQRLQASTAAPPPVLQQAPVRIAAPPAPPPRVIRRDPPPAAVPSAATQIGSLTDTPHDVLQLPRFVMPEIIPSSAEKLRRSVFGDRAGIVRAIVASEVFGRPVALRDDPAIRGYNH
jgi:hypothetical protein